MEIKLFLLKPMEIKLFLSVILLFASTGTMKKGQASGDVVFYAGVHFVNPIPVKCNCNNSKRSLLTVTVAGGVGEERLVVQTVEYNGRVCDVSPPPPHDAIIDVGQTPLQSAPTTPDLAEEHADTIGKVYGGGSGGGPGGEPGGGGDDPSGGDDGGADSNSDENSGGSDNNSNGDVGAILSGFQIKTLKKLSEISINVAAQTGVSLVAQSRDKPTFAVYFVVGICICAYFFCFLSIMSENQLTKAITGAIGTLLAAVGFFLTVSIVVLPFSVWALVLSSLFLIISIVRFFIK